MYHNSKLTSVEQLYDVRLNGDDLVNGALERCERFIMSLTDREEQKRALMILNSHFSGEMNETTDEDLNEFLNEIAKLLDDECNSTS